MKKLVFALCCVAGLLWAPSARAFVMIGPMDVSEVSDAARNIDFNYTDDLGGPKDLKTFFRLNTPMLTYAFDASFMQYFGLEGREAVKEAFTIVNDFFDNTNYTGVSSLDYRDHGFLSNYNTTWVNTTAKNAGIIDIKSLVLGMVINQLGLGNPHRYAFGARSIFSNSTGTQLNFNVRLRNFDPITFKPTSVINGVTYSYRLIHDATPTAGLQPGGQMPSFVDMEEFTTDTSGNAWTAVAGIVDAFYGNTAIYWTDQPTLFGFGVFYSGKYAMGGAYQPRHALTYDDAGGLHYLYRKNNIVYENLDPNVALVIPANFLPTFAIPVFPNGSPRVFPDPSGVSGAYIPRRNAGIIPGLPITSSLPAQTPPALVDVALRGGIDKMQFIEQPFDSFLGITFTATNHIWIDRFVSTNGQNVIGLNNTAPGASAYIGIPQLAWFTQTVGRGIFRPDIIFVADELGVSPDGVPIAFNRTDSTAWIDNFTNNLGPVQVLTTNVGPGLIVGPMQYTFTKLGEGFEVIWSGEASVVGNTNSYSLWGHIKGPGPQDVVTFPNDAQMHILENVLTPATAVPTITEVYDSGQDSVLTRTQESLTIEGQLLNSVEFIQIMNGNLVEQTIGGSQVQTFIKSHQLIVIPAGVINDIAEGASRTVRVWNTLGASPASTDTIGIHTGKPVITGTSRDNLTFDRAQTLTVYGYGFLSSQISGANDGNRTLTYFRVEKSDGTMLYPASSNSSLVSTFEIRSDREAVLPLDAIDSNIADGPNRRLRVARGSSSLELTVTNNVPLIANITTKPVITGLNSVDSNGSFRRDESIDIIGTALNTAYRIELINSDGTSLSPVMQVDLPAAGVTVDDNGSRIQISRDVFYTTQADGNASGIATKEFKVYNAVGNTIDNNASFEFSVNAQPTALFVAGFTSPNTFNRDKTTGDDVTITGTNLKNVYGIVIVDENGSALPNEPAISLPGNTGVTVTDNSIVIDTETAQFLDGNSSDSNATSLYRRFALTGPRDTVYTPQDQRFYVGVPPKYTSYSGLSSSSTSGAVNYRRDNNTFTVNGSGLGVISSVEIVDLNGNTIAANTSVDTNTGITSVNKTQFTIAANSFPNANFVDAASNSTRRLKITTPFGIVVSDNNSSGAFSVSATPAFLGNAAATFAGGGYDGGSNTYDLSTGSLVINGSNFLGVKTIQFENNASNPEVFISATIEPAAPPAGITFNSTGTQITITSQYISDNNASWADVNATNARRIRLYTPADQNGSTQQINTQP